MSGTSLHAGWIPLHAQGVKTFTPRSGRGNVTFPCSCLFLPFLPEFVRNARNLANPCMAPIYSIFWPILASFLARYKFPSEAPSIVITSKARARPQNGGTITGESTDRHRNQQPLPPFLPRDHVHMTSTLRGRGVSQKWPTVRGFAWI